MFTKVVEWKVGIESEFCISAGKAGKFLKAYLSNDFYERILLTYSNSNTEENWKALFLMSEIFQETSNFIANKFGFSINENEEQNTIAYLEEQYEEQKKYS
jgi:aminoglycoside 6-adenylyltransferase